MERLIKYLPDGYSSALALLAIALIFAILLR
jgi:hypothetical protein